MPDLTGLCLLAALVGWPVAGLLVTYRLFNAVEPKKNLAVVSREARNSSAPDSGVSA